jgi:hypothetical protein
MELRELHKEAEQINAVLRRLIEALRERVRRTRELLGLLQETNNEPSR